MTDTDRWLNDLPLRDGDDARKVGWCELTTTDAEGNVLYRNAWASSVPITWDNVVAIAAAGRSRWKIENENNNTLKTKGYRFEHLRALTLYFPFDTWEHLLDSMIEALQPAQPPPRRRAGKR